MDNLLSGWVIIHSHRRPGLMFECTKLLIIFSPKRCSFFFKVRSLITHWMGCEGFVFGLRFSFGDSSNPVVVTKRKTKSKNEVTKLAVSCHHCVPEIIVSLSNNTCTTQRHQHQQHPTPATTMATVTTNYNDDNNSNEPPSYWTLNMIRIVWLLCNITAALFLWCVFSLLVCKHQQ